MKKLAVINKTACTACGRCVDACAALYCRGEKFKYARLRLDAAASKPVACIQCGKCMRACPEGAIFANAAGIYQVDRDKCISCGACVRACPMHVMVLRPGFTAEKCISCGVCVKTCPEGVLAIAEK